MAEPPAGAVLYTESAGEVYLLLAEHGNGHRGWAGFGGGGREGETLAETAAHKVEEESRGYYDREDILKRIGDQNPIMDGEFAFYFVKVDFVPAQRITNHPLASGNDAYQERSTFAWIPYSTIAPHLASDIARTNAYMVAPEYLPRGSSTGWLWRAWLGNMRKAVVAGAIPWAK